MAAANVYEEQPILSRLDRVDNILRQLEEMRGGGGQWSPKSSGASSSGSGTLTGSEDGGASFDFSPRSLEKHCRPLGDVITDTEHKGSLVQRLVSVEDKLVKLEQQLEAERKRQENEKKAPKSKSKSKKQGLLKQLVRSCMK